MELIKELPDVFEESCRAETEIISCHQRIKRQGVPVVGTFCTYFPVEIAILGSGYSKPLLYIR